MRSGPRRHANRPNSTTRPTLVVWKFKVSKTHTMMFLIYFLNDNDPYKHVQTFTFLTPYPPPTTTPIFNFFNLFLIVMHFPSFHGFKCLHNVPKLIITIPWYHHSIQLSVKQKEDPLPLLKKGHKYFGITRKNLQGHDMN